MGEVSTTKHNSRILSPKHISSRTCTVLGWALCVVVFTMMSHPVAGSHRFPYGPEGQSKVRGSLSTGQLVTPVVPCECPLGQEYVKCRRVPNGQKCPDQKCNGTGKVDQFYTEGYLKVGEIQKTAFERRIRGVVHKGEAQ